MPIIPIGKDREFRPPDFGVVFSCQAARDRGFQGTRQSPWETTKKPGDEDRSVKHLVTISRDMFSTTQDHTQ